MDEEAVDRTRGDIETGIEGLEIRPFDIGTASDGELRAFWAFRMWEWRDVYPEDPETPFEQWLEGFRNSTLSREARFWAIWSADVVRGYALVHVSAAGLDPWLG